MDKRIFISQSKYVKDLVKKFWLENTKHARIPMSTSLKLSRDTSGKDIDQTLYRSMIGNLLYLTASRPDIAFSVGICARFQTPKSRICLLSNESLNMSIEILGMVFGLPWTQMRILLGILLQIGQDLLMIVRAPLAGVFMEIITL